MKRYLSLIATGIMGIALAASCGTIDQTTPSKLLSATAGQVSFCLYGARELLGAEGEKAMVAAVEYGQLTDAATPRIGGIALSNLPVWLVSFDRISIPAVNGYIFTKALVVVDAETGQPLMMLQ